MVKTILFAIILGLFGLLPVFGADPAGATGQHPPGSGLPGAPASAAAHPMADIHDIRPPVAPGLNPWLLIGLPAALLTGILAALWVYLRLKRSDVAKKAIPCDPPDAVALKALNNLAQYSDLDGRRFYFRLSAIIRLYMQERFEIDALEMTIEQLLPAIGRLDLDDTLRQKLKTCLSDAEPIKFAGRPADKSRMNSDMAFAVDFVRQTTSVAHKVEHN